MNTLECQVCENPVANKYNHYGAEQICASCRAFFLRAVKNQLFDSFEHSKEKCAINSKDRTSCKKCRFDKCLAVGMEVKYVMTSKALPKPKIAPLTLTFLSEDKSNLNLKYSEWCNASSQGIFQMCSKNYSHFYTYFFQPKELFSMETIKFIEGMDLDSLAKGLITTLKSDKIIEKDAYKLVKRNHHSCNAFIIGLCFKPEVILLLFIFQKTCVT